MRNERYRGYKILPAKVLSRSQIVRPRIKFVFYIMLFMRIKLSGEVNDK